MTRKRKSKNTKSTKERIAKESKKETSHNRIYVEKHSNVMEYLYDSESSEIEAMIQSANKIAEEEENS